MRIRPYLKKDFDVISKWITDECSHALWCADLIPYPLEKKSFDDLLIQAEEQFDDSPFVAAADEGTVVGFFCFSVNLKTKVGFKERALTENVFTFKDEVWGRCNMIKVQKDYVCGECREVGILDGEMNWSE